MRALKDLFITIIWIPSIIVVYVLLLSTLDIYLFNIISSYLLIIIINFFLFILLYSFTNLEDKNDDNIKNFTIVMLLLTIIIIPAIFIKVTYFIWLPVANKVVKEKQEKIKIKQEQIKEQQEKIAKEKYENKIITAKEIKKFPIKQLTLNSLKEYNANWKIKGENYWVSAWLGWIAGNAWVWWFWAWYSKNNSFIIWTMREWKSFIYTFYKGIKLDNWEIWYKITKINANKTFIIESAKIKNPTLKEKIVCKVKRKNKIEGLNKCNNITYYIYIPKNTILNKYNINIK